MYKVDKKLENIDKKLEELNKQKKQLMDIKKNKPLTKTQINRLIRLGKILDEAGFNTPSEAKKILKEKGILE